MQLTGAEIICECLLEQGVDTVFGWDGGFILLLSACAVTVVLMLFCKENRL